MPRRRPHHSHHQSLHDIPADPARTPAAASGQRTGAEWHVAERTFAPERLPALESVLAVGNGYLGLRGAPEEGAPAHDAGVVLNGFHETWPIVYPEDAYGLARTGQTIVDAPDGTIIRLAVDGERFDLATAALERYERVLDLATGVLTREVEFRGSRPRGLTVDFVRLSRTRSTLGARDGEAVVRLAVSGCGFRGSPRCRPGPATAVC